MSAPLFVAPVFKERVWGGSDLRSWYSQPVPEGSIGESWAISGLPGDSGRVLSGPGSGGSLEDAWHQGLVTGRPESGDFPLLAKVLAPTDWLSVQVHPDDAQARELEAQPRGKAECWYVIAAEPGAELILGHDLPDGAALRAAAEAHQLDAHLIREPVQAGAFFMVPAGCVHAVGPGQLIYEVQQSSDITYRLYDFERPGLDGLPRELHQQKGFSVVTRYDPAGSKTAGAARPTEGGTVRTLVANELFTVTEYRVVGSLQIDGSDSYWLGTVVAGSGVLTAGGQHEVRRGTSLVQPARSGPVTVSGSLTVIVTTPPS